MSGKGRDFVGEVQKRPRELLKEEGDTRLDGLLTIRTGSELPVERPELTSPTKSEGLLDITGMKKRGRYTCLL
jgi:hypothetical protein